MTLRSRTVAQWYCLLFGTVLVVRGALQLVMGAGFSVPGDGWHSTFHLLSGAGLLLAYGAGPRAAWAAVGAFAAVYGAITVAGIVDGSDLFGVSEIDPQANVIHAVYVVLALATLALSDQQARGDRDARA